MKFRTRIALGLTATVLVLGTAACGDKATEQFNDAGRGSTNDAKADIVTFPDGFSNVATKCDNGNRVYVVFRGDGQRAGISVVPADPSCDRSQG